MNQNFTNNVSDNVNSSNNKRFNKKSILLICLLGIILIILGLFFIYKSNDTVSNHENKNIKLTPFKSNPDSLFNPSYGYKDQDGNIIIEGKYDVASEFYGDYAKVVISMDDTYYTQIIDKNENIIFSYSKSECDRGTCIQYYEDYNAWIINQKLYNSNLKLLTDEGTIVKAYDYGYLAWLNSSTSTTKGGIMLFDGTITYTYNFTDKSTKPTIEIKPSKMMDGVQKERYCTVKTYGVLYGDKNGQTAIVNCDTGKIVYDYQEHTIVVQDYNKFYVQISYGVNQYMYFQNDKLIVQRTSSVDNGYFDVDKNGYVEICDKTEELNKYGNNIYDCKYYDMRKNQLLDEKPTN